MSETTEQAGHPSQPVPASDYRPAESLSSEPDAPEQQPAQEATEQAEPEPEQHQETEAERWERERKEYNRRLGQTTKQKYLERERANQLQRELAELRARYEQGQAPNGPTNGVPPDWLQHPQVRAQIEARAAEEARAAAFHRAAAAEYPDWDTRRSELIKMGADPGIAQILLEMPNGHRVAGALYDEPAELERISDMETERARAVALGQFAARIEARRAPAASSSPPRRASNLSEPIKPPSAARSRGEPNPNGSMEEYERWSKQQNWRNR